MVQRTASKDWILSLIMEVELKFLLRLVKFWIWLVQVLFKDFLGGRTLIEMKIPLEIRS